LKSEVRLTEDEKEQAGAIWYLEKIDLKKDFDVYFQMNFGDNDDLNGADGMAFMLQPVSANALSIGGGIGYKGIDTSLICEFDTYPNTNFEAYDPFSGCDHMAIQQNGINRHNYGTVDYNGELTAPICFDSLTDGEYHKIIVKWRYTPNEQTFTVYFLEKDTIEYKGNIIQDIFFNDPMVFIGFTSATGNATNEHYVKLDYVTIYEELEDTTTYCTYDPIQLNYPVPGINYKWTPITPNVQPSDLSSDTVANPVFTPSGSGVFGFKIEFDHSYYNSKTNDTIYIKVHPPFEISASKDSICPGSMATLKVEGENAVEYKWGDNPVDTSSIYTQTTDSSISIPLIAYDINGCMDKDTGYITVFDSIEIELADVLPETGPLCFGDSLQIPLTSTNIDIGKIAWTPTQFLNNPNTNQPFVKPDSSLYYYYKGLDIHGCSFSGNIYIYVEDEITANFNYRITDSIYPDFSVDFMNLSSDNAVAWNWDFGDSKTSSEKNPSHVYSNSNKYNIVLTAFSENGCKDTAMRNIILSQPLEYTIPNVITPNQDNINDIFAPDITGEYAAYSMQIYNRWGKLVFETEEINNAWEGKNMNLQDLAAGTYYYIITITKIDGTIEENKGNVSLLRENK